MYPYVLAHSVATILVVSEGEPGVCYVTAWEPAGKWHRGGDQAGAGQCAGVAVGEWARVDWMRHHEVGVPPPWKSAWEQIYRLVPELKFVGMESRGMVLVLGDPRRHVHYARERARRETERRRSGRGKSGFSDSMKDVGPLGLGGSRSS